MRSRCELCENTGRRGGLPRRQTRPARPTRTRPARVGGANGKETEEIPRGLPAMPRRHPRHSCHERGVVTGEPRASKGARVVRREAARKGPRFTNSEPDTSPCSPPCPLCARPDLHPCPHRLASRRAESSSTPPLIPRRRSTTTSRYRRNHDGTRLHEPRGSSGA